MLFAFLVMLNASKALGQYVLNTTNKRTKDYRHGLEIAILNRYAPTGYYSTISKLGTFGALGIGLQLNFNVLNRYVSRGWIIGFSYVGANSRESVKIPNPPNNDQVEITTKGGIFSFHFLYRFSWAPTRTFSLFANAGYNGAVEFINQDIYASKINPNGQWLYTINDGYKSSWGNPMFKGGGGITIGKHNSRYNLVLGADYFTNFGLFQSGLIDVESVVIHSPNFMKYRSKKFDYGFWNFYIGLRIKFNGEGGGMRWSFG